MLKNIRLHIEKNENKQKALEQNLAQHINHTYTSNINKLQRTIPSLVAYAAPEKRPSISVFCNKFGEYNLVDYGTGRVVYGFHPKKEIAQQIKAFSQHCPYIPFAQADKRTHKRAANFEQSLLNALPRLDRLDKQPKAPEKIECLVVLGCGLGLHIESLLANFQIQHLIVYEAEPQFFSTSLLVTDWTNILNLAAKKNTSMYLQIGSDGRDVLNDINELRQHTDIQGFYLFKHFSDKKYNAIDLQLTESTWENLNQRGLSLPPDKDAKLRFSPLWTPINQWHRYTALSKDNIQFQSNLAAFEKFYPNIFAQFKDYSPKHWLPVLHNNGQVNVIEKQSLASIYTDSPAKDCALMVKDFEKHPNRDGLDLGYSGEKLGHYAHYSLLKKMDKILNRHEEKRESLPKDIQSIIVFGLGVGYQFEELYNRHAIKNMFLCEPNPDFFYASLFAIDWHAILKQVYASDARLYINVGDDGTNLFRDLLAQFYSIGPYILNNTYFFQSYHNDALNLAVSQLREQLQIVISIGEYFDHAYYGINHTVEGIKRGYPILKNSPSKHLSFDDKDVPVFILGAGPSVDSAIGAIKECQRNAIIISCGTALKVLHKHGITPDFHAEIEQNRSTFEWCSLIEDHDYLKSISLISCNGIHPDTGDLFKQTLVVFKEGESSTTSTLNVYGEENVEVIKFAFPTVANFACNLFSILGFRNIYLLGIDLGFIDKQKHHSSATGYYANDGTEIGDYAAKYNMSIVVEGNLRPTVLTKPEFKMSKQVIEQTIRAAAKDVIFFNCSDGAKISGATPLSIDSILLLTDHEQKENAVNTVKHHAFGLASAEGFIAKYSEKYRHQALCEELKHLETLINRPITTHQDLLALIETHKRTLFSSYEAGSSLLFYYLYGTVNYANAAFSKLIDHKKPNKRASKDLKQAVALWQETFAWLATLLSRDLNLFDATTVHKLGLLERHYLTKEVCGKNFLFVTDSLAVAKSARLFWTTRFNQLDDFTCIPFSQLSQTKINQYDYVVYDECSRNEPESAQLNSANYSLGQRSTLVMGDFSQQQIAFFLAQHSAFTVLQIDLANAENAADLLFTKYNLAYFGIKVCIDNLSNQVIIPKHYVNQDSAQQLDPAMYFPNLCTRQVTYTYHEYLSIPPTDRNIAPPLTASNTRGKPIHSKIESKDMIMNLVSQSQFNEILLAQIEDVPELANDKIFESISELTNSPSS